MVVQVRASVGPESFDRHHNSDELQWWGWIIRVGDRQAEPASMTAFLFDLLRRGGATRWSGWS